MSTDTVPGCILEFSVATLSAWRDGALLPAEAQRLQAHIPDCAACRERLAEYDTIAYGLAAVRVPEPVGGYGRSPRAILAAHREHNGRHPLRLAGGLGALAAVVLLTLLFAQLFRSMGGRMTPTATATSTATRSPLAVCGGTQIALRGRIDRVVGDHEGYGFTLWNIATQDCVINGYPTIVVSGASESVTLAMQDTLSAPTFQTEAPREITLQGTRLNDRATTADFFLDWTTTASPGQVCITAQSFTVISVGTANLVASDLTTDAPQTLCGPLSISPAVPTPEAAQPPRTAAGLPVCQVYQLVLGSEGPLPTDFNVTPPRVGGISALQNDGIRACMLEGYPTLAFFDSSGQPLAVPIQQATSAPTYKMQPPEAIPLAPGDSAYFAVDYSTASNPDDACNSSSNQIWSISPPGSAGSLRTIGGPLTCGVIYVSPLQAQP